MKKNIQTIGLLVLILFSFSVHGQTPDEMKAYMNYMTPGTVQQMMAKSAGNWTAAVTMWQKEGAPPMTSTMESTSEMILGGRYLQSKDKGKMYGMPFEGVAITGYDNAKKMFASTWIDNMGTGVMFLSGNWDAATNSMILTGNTTDPLTGNDVSVKQILKFVDDNHQEMEMYSTKDGKVFKTMEIKFTRI